MNGLSILIVDDESLTRRALRSGIHFQELGIESIFEAGSATSAKEILQKESIDLALIDIEMPGESGLELLAWIRKEISDSMPCAFLTCHASFPYAQEALRLKSSDYILKPVENEKIEALLSRMIARFQSTQEYQETVSLGRQWVSDQAEAGRQYEKSGMSTEDILDQTIRYIDEHLSEKIVVSELSREMGLTQNYFNKIFREKTGETLNKYIIRKKMELAGEMLRKKGTKAYEVSEFLGYENYANFVNMFKKIYGKSPNVWQEHPDADS